MSFRGIGFSLSSLGHLHKLNPGRNFRTVGTVSRMTQVFNGGAYLWAALGFLTDFTTQQVLPKKVLLVPGAFALWLLPLCAVSTICCIPT